MTDEPKVTPIQEVHSKFCAITLHGHKNCDCEIGKIGTLERELLAERQKVESKEQERVAEWNAKREAYGQRDAANAACEVMRQKVERIATVDGIVEAMREMSPQARLNIGGRWFCHGCGSLNPRCQCENDE